MLANESLCCIMNDVLRIGLATAATFVPFQWNFFAIADQVRWIERMGMHLVVVAEKRIKTMLLRNAG